MLRRLSSLFAVFALVGSIGAWPEPTSDEFGYGLKKFEVWRQYPDQLAKLRQAGREYASLSAGRREQLEKLDRDLASETSATQAKLHDILDRYADWLKRLPEKDRERIRDAPDKAARLAIVKDLREREWLLQQPKAIRDAIDAIPAEARPAAIVKARAEDRQRHAEWIVARRFWDDIAKSKPLPSKLADFEDPVRVFVNDVLWRNLNKDERERLAKAEGQWPLYPQTLVELADNHPPALPAADGPRAFADLPKAVRDSIINKKIVLPIKSLRLFEGRYPEFAMKLTGLASEKKVILPLEWWVYNFNGLNPPMQDFLKKKMEPLLDRKELRRLVEAEGKWPEYPETIEKLALAHNLRAPWFTLPGNHERWDAYRFGRQPTVPGYPELPKYKLRDFAFFDLDDLDRVKFKNEIDRARAKSDAEAWAYLVDLYFQRYPSELARLRQNDRERLGLKVP
jgi:hypothetical protein